MEAKTAVTLRALSALARWLYRLRIVSLVMALGAAGWFAQTVVSPSTDSARALLALSVLLWSILALGAGLTLVQPPPVLTSADRWLQRLRKRMLQAGYWLLAGGFLGLAGLAALMSLRALRLIFFA